jgi:hypothetical protein
MKISLKWIQRKYLGLNTSVGPMVMMGRFLTTVKPIGAATKIVKEKNHWFMYYLKFAVALHQRQSVSPVYQQI